MLLATAALALVFGGCKNQDPFDTQSTSDSPRILKPYNESGTGSFTYSLMNPDTEMLDSAVVTPSAYTTVQWIVDGEVIVEGLKIQRTFMAGEHDLRILATTQAGLSTYRDGKIVVSPYDYDPYAAATDLERHVASGMATYLEGAHLDQVTAIRLYTGYHAEMVAELTSFTAAAGRIDFTVPELAAATYHVVLVDAEGKEYGANRLYVHDEPVITAGFDRFIVGKDWTISGFNLDGVTEILLGDEALTEYETSEGAIRLVGPELEEGEYSLYISANGKPATFITKKGEMLNEVTIVCAATQAIVVGEESYIGCNGAAEWTALPITKEFDWSTVAAGTILHIEAEWLPGAEYAKMQILCNESWEGSSGDMEVAQGKAVYDYELTAERLALIQTSGHVYAAGSGVHIFRVFMDAPDETVIWEGEVVINWGDVNVSLPKEVTSGIREGAEILVYYEIVEADYHAFRLSTTWWGDDPATCDIVPQIDEFHTQPNPFVFEYDARAKGVADSRGEWMFVGFGYKLLKVAVK